MLHQTLAEWWNEAWHKGLWAAPWSKAAEGLTPQQAAWKPAAQRHSIWQIVNHIIFWREDAVARLAGGSAPSEDEIARVNFVEPPQVTDAAWHAARQRLERSQEALAAALAQPNHSLDRLRFLLPHDCYHFGQIMLLRALQGLTAIE